MNEPTDLSGIDSPEEPPTNDLATACFIAGVGGWVLAAIGICPVAAAFTGGFSGVGCTTISLVAWVAALPLGYLARQQIKERGEGGNNLARWGMLTGATGLGLTILMFCLVFIAVMLGALSLPFLD